MVNELFCKLLQFSEDKWIAKKYSLIHQLLVH